MDHGSGYEIVLYRITGSRIDQVRKSFPVDLKKITVITARGNTHITDGYSRIRLTHTCPNRILNSESPDIASRTNTPCLNFTTDFEHEVSDTDFIERIARQINRVTFGD